MRFVDCVDYGDAPTICMSGVASIDLVDDELQITHYVKIAMPDGTVENRVSCRVRISWRKWIVDEACYREAMTWLMGEVAKLGSRVGMH